MSSRGGVRNPFTRLNDKTVLVDGQPPRFRRPDFWARLLSEAMDLLTYAAIYVTAEIGNWPFAVAGALTATRLVFGFRFRTLWMVAGFLVQIFIGVQLVLRMQIHPIVAAAHVAPIAMAWIGLTRGAEDLWGWRMGLGFMGLILASALTPDFSVMIMILAFIVSGSIALACRFLANEFVKRGVNGSLPAGFIRTSFYQSGVLLFSALLIFPLIPRVQGKGGGGFGSDSTKSGYTEDVNLNEWTRVSNQGSTTPALRIYGPNGTDPTPYIPGGLLRSRVLSILDANHWNPAPVRVDPSRSLGDVKTSATLMIVKEMIGSPNLPVPYGTTDVSVELYGYKWGAERTKITEWREGRSRNQRFNYHPTVDPKGKRAPQDVPTSIELVVPENFRTERMEALVDQLFHGKKTPEAKIAAVQAHLQKEKFIAAYAEDDPGIKANLEERKLPPIERFLFVEKSGHCELFASATAILLRMGGIPTRLIAGFRVNRNAYGDVLTVRQSDAHAWVEAYLPKHGWTVIDPTPKIMHFSTVVDFLRDTYDWASAKWTQYILNYGEGENSIGAQWQKIKRIGSQIASGKNPFKSADADANIYLFAVIFLVGSVLFSVTAVSVYRRIRARKSVIKLEKVKRDLIAERARMEKTTARLTVVRGDRSEIDLAVRGWYVRYERARFGIGSGLDKETLNEIRRDRVAIESKIRATGT